MLGFPAVTEGAPVNAEGDITLSVATVSLGEIVSFRIWPGCTNPIAQNLLVEGGASSACSPEGDLERGNLLSSDLSGSGGSGGPVVVDGEFVGIRYAVGGSQPGAVATAGGAEYPGGVLRRVATGADRRLGILLRRSCRRREAWRASPMGWWLTDSRVISSRRGVRQRVLQTT